VPRISSLKRDSQLLAWMAAACRPLTEKGGLVADKNVLMLDGAVQISSRGFATDAAVKPLLTMARRPGRICCLRLHPSAPI
jgi:hypothetical protein